MRSTNSAGRNSVLIQVRVEETAKPICRDRLALSEPLLLSVAIGCSSAALLKWFRFFQTEGDIGKLQQT